MTMADFYNGSALGFEVLYARADEAGRKAAAEAVKGMKHYAVMQGNQQVGHLHGLCGFGWVVVKDRKLGNWLKKKGIGHKGYGGGVHIWISDYNQSHDQKAAHASAMAKVFTDCGYVAYGDSRLD
jgi:hypothetical protein